MRRKWTSFCWSGLNCIKIIYSNKWIKEKKATTKKEKEKPNRNESPNSFSFVLFGIAITKVPKEIDTNREMRSFVLMWIDVRVFCTVSLNAKEKTHIHTFTYTEGEKWMNALTSVHHSKDNSSKEFLCFHLYSLFQRRKKNWNLM